MLLKWRIGIAILLVLSLAGMASAREKVRQPGPVRLEMDGEIWAQKTLKLLTLEQKIGQMLVIWSRAQFFNNESYQYQQLRGTIRKYQIGALGLTVPVDSGLPQKVMPYEAAALTNQLQAESGLPLLFAADFEYGLTMRVQGATPFPYPMAFGAGRSVANAEAFGRIVAEEARAIGVHWNWFPTADVNSNPANPIINTRAFGEDPAQVGELLAAYIRGAHQGGMLTTAKHFPGHGDTSTDTHIGLATVSGDTRRLEAVELLPFREAIRAGVDSVMTAHVTVPALDSDPAHVASISPAVVSGLLKRKMGFQGLVVTDSLDMYGLMRLYAKSPSPSAAAAVAAVKAGNDMVLLPPDLDSAYQALLRAVRSGDIPMSQIDGSVLKILRAKASLGLHRSRMVDLNRLPQTIARPGNLVVAERTAGEAITLVRDRASIVPLRPGASGVASTASGESKSRRTVAVVFIDDLRAETGRAFVRELRARVPGATIFYADAQIAGAIAEPVLAAIQDAQAVIAAVYVVPVSGKAVQVGNEVKNTVSLTGDSAVLMKRLLASAGSRALVVALGNPYLLADFPEIPAYLCTFSSLPISEVVAVRALFGELPIHGRMPVSIPGLAQRGDGMDRPAMAYRSASAQRKPR